MKSKWVSKLLENRKVVRTGCGLMAAVVLLSGGFYIYNSQESIPELPVIVEEDGVIISDEEVPLASAPTVKKTTKTKKSTKKVKMSTASTKTYSKKLPTTTKTTTTTKNSATETVKTVVKTTTSVVEKYTKKSKVKKVVTTVKTETTVTTTKKAVTATKAATNSTPNAAVTSSTPVHKTLMVSTAIPKADANVRDAYAKLGFTLQVDSTVGYSGKFDARARTITMRKENDDAIYHELGHFLMFMANRMDEGTEAKNIYTAEKALYTGFNKSYVNQNAQEYFAESYRDYCTERAALQASRPQTYAMIEKALGMVTDAQVAKYQKIYAPIWK